MDINYSESQLAIASSFGFENLDFQISDESSFQSRHKIFIQNLEDVFN
jgi:hypothetical protein